MNNSMSLHFTLLAGKTINALSARAESIQAGASENSFTDELNLAKLAAARIYLNCVRTRIFSPNFANRKAEESARLDFVAVMSISL